MRRFFSLKFQSANLSADRQVSGRSKCNFTPSTSNSQQILSAEILSANLSADRQVSG
jgi:hypothetical protein